MYAASIVEVVFYGDFNCPYCFAENERLLRMGRDDTLEFRPIEHMPELPVPWDPSNVDLRAKLDTEMARYAERAPDVPVAAPLTLPSSRRATIAYAEALAVDGVKARRLGTALFRALWLDGRDLSAPDVLDEAWRSAELGDRPDPPSRDAVRAARVWGVEWATGPFDRRIPVLTTPDRQRLLGLAEPEQIERFLADPRRGAHLPDVCRGERAS